MSVSALAALIVLCLSRNVSRTMDRFERSIRIHHGVYVDAGSMGATNANYSNN